MAYQSLLIIFTVLEWLIGATPITKLGTDMLSTSIYLNAETKINWY